MIIDFKNCFILLDLSDVVSNADCSCGMLGNASKISEDLCYIIAQFEIGLKINHNVICIGFL